MQFTEKEIIINAHTKPVYDLFEESLTHVKFKNPNQKEPIEAEQETLRKGFQFKILGYFEALTENEMGAKMSKLRALRETHDPEARYVFERYRAIINKMIKSVSYYDYQGRMIQDKIEHGGILFCELLERMVAIALCDDTINYDGEAYIKAIQHFCTSYHDKILKNKSAAQRSHYMDFIIILNGELAEHLTELKRVVEFIRQLHKPKETFNRFRSYFERVKIVARMQLSAAVFTNAFFTSSAIASLHPRYLVDGELDSHESTLFTNPRYSPREKAIVLSRSLNKENDGDFLQFVQSRYEIIEKVESTLIMLDGLLMMVGTCGWLIFFTNMIDVHALYEEINNVDAAADKLNIVRHPFEFTKANNDALVLLRGMHIGYKTDLEEGFSGLAVLASPKTKLMLQQRFINALRMVFKAQEDLHSDNAPFKRVINRMWWETFGLSEDNRTQRFDAPANSNLPQTTRVEIHDEDDDAPEEKSDNNKGKRTMSLKDKIPSTFLGPKKKKTNHDDHDRHDKSKHRSPDHHQ